MSENGVGTWNNPSADKYLVSTAAPSDEKAKINNAVGGHGICPVGWHIPTDYEWAVLLDLVDTAADPDYSAQTGTGWHGSVDGIGGDHVGAGVKMKSASTYIGSDPGNDAWADNDARGNNATGFGAVPAGCRNVSPQFSNQGSHAIYWSSSVVSGTNAWYRTFTYNYAQVNRNSTNRSNGFSVRCVKD
jgi:uncharacterized protein (TIGR02145 family)